MLLERKSVLQSILEIHQVKPQGPLGWNLERGTNCLECHFVFKRKPDMWHHGGPHKNGWIILIILVHTFSFWTPHFRKIYSVHTWRSDNSLWLYIPSNPTAYVHSYLVKNSRLGWPCNAQLVSICHQEDFLSGFQLNWCCPFNAFRPKTTFPKSCKGFWPTLLHVHDHRTMVCRRLENQTTQNIITCSYLAFDTLSSSL